MGVVDRVRIEPWSERDLDLLRRHLHAFPSVSNSASNAICRKLGFRFVAEVDFEYPPGSMIRSNDCCLDLVPSG